jgi:hypothetical protein
MERRMEAVEVWTRDGAIYVAQDKTGDRSGVVKLTGDQVPLLVEWLQAARSDLTTTQPAQ